MSLGCRPRGGAGSSTSRNGPGDDGRPKPAVTFGHVVRGRSQPGTPHEIGCWRMRLLTRCGVIARSGRWSATMVMSCPRRLCCGFCATRATSCRISISASVASWPNAASPPSPASRPAQIRSGSWTSPSSRPPPAGPGGWPMPGLLVQVRTPVPRVSDREPVRRD